MRALPFAAQPVDRREIGEAADEEEDRHHLQQPRRAPQARHHADHVAGVELVAVPCHDGHQPVTEHDDGNREQPEEIDVAVSRVGRLPGELGCGRSLCRHGSHRRVHRAPERVEEGDHDCHAHRAPREDDAAIDRSRQVALRGRVRVANEHADADRDGGGRRDQPEPPGGLVAMRRPRAWAPVRRRWRPVVRARNRACSRDGRWEQVGTSGCMSCLQHRAARPPAISGPSPKRSGENGRTPSAGGASLESPDSAASQHAHPRRRPAAGRRHSPPRRPQGLSRDPGLVAASLHTTTMPSRPSVDHRALPPTSRLGS